MRKQSPETYEPHPLSRMSDTTAYSAHIQEAMRYDKLGSLDYSMVFDDPACGSTRLDGRAVETRAAQNREYAFTATYRQDKLLC